MRGCWRVPDLQHSSTSASVFASTSASASISSYFWKQVGTDSQEPIHPSSELRPSVRPLTLAIKTIQ